MKKILIITALLPFAFLAQGQDTLKTIKVEITGSLDWNESSFFFPADTTGDKQTDLEVGTANQDLLRQINHLYTNCNFIDSRLSYKGTNDMSINSPLLRGHSVFALCIENKDTGNYEIIDYWLK
jgi:hypothetical protein